MSVISFQIRIVFMPFTCTLSYQTPCQILYTCTYYIYINASTEKLYALQILDKKFYTLIVTSK